MQIKVFEPPDVPHDEGTVDFDRVKQEVAAKGVELRGGAADEAPAAYKDLFDVVAAHGDAIAVVHVLRPVGVCMADERTHDPYKD